MIRRAPLALSLLLGLASAAQAGPARQCVDQSEALVGQRARLVDKDFPAPRKLPSVPPDYPTRPGATKVSEHLGRRSARRQDGKVRDVWTIRAASTSSRRGRSSRTPCAPASGRRSTSRR